MSPNAEPSGKYSWILNVLLGIVLTALLLTLGVIIWASIAILF